MLRFDILSIFPEMFRSPFDASLIGKAREKGKIEIHLHDIRDYAEGRHRMTDDYPYGGGGGMVMKVEPVARALEAVVPDRDGAIVVLLTPQGEPLRQGLVEELASWPRVVMICGHYEGVDERIRSHLADREVSIGDYILTGGELAAMVLVDAVSRLVPGVLGNSGSPVADSFSTGLLEYPQYTRPENFREWKVPDVLLSGHHKAIEDWRKRESLKRTWRRRRDLLEAISLPEEDRKILQSLILEDEQDGP
ncbi:MAG: tRNA (guanosine(37)-N1)-methyltransferase TrmD [Deltaproteobacteria bacterium HGW-Deltaproteobacteria-19]|jgi:tRNA (guanine37-N1)-methyltransferase|nr:MAG: tRNA (guanosine(37)-N1)-methyltransferase TrmD [Deltaproteobacteria bacterium HGW-Deltaproteobacteria-19]